MRPLVIKARSKRYIKKQYLAMALVVAIASLTYAIAIEGYIELMPELAVFALALIWMVLNGLSDFDKVIVTSEYIEVFPFWGRNSKRFFFANMSGYRRIYARPSAEEESEGECLQFFLRHKRKETSLTIKFFGHQECGLVIQLLQQARVKKMPASIPLA